MFQHILMVTVGCLFVLSLWLVYKGWVSRLAGVLWAAIWLVAGLTIHWPWLTSKVAHVLNIGRGADLVFYCGMVVMMVGFWVLYVRLRRLRREITLLTRQIALHEAEETLRHRTPAGAAGPPAKADSNP
jgi:hypothetical protein